MCGEFVVIKKIIFIVPFIEREFEKSLSLIIIKFQVDCWILEFLFSTLFAFEIEGYFFKNVPKTRGENICFIVHWTKPVNNFDTEFKQKSCLPAVQKLIKYEIFKILWSVITCTGLSVFSISYFYNSKTLINVKKKLP